MDAARLGLEDRTVTLTPTGGPPLVLTTVMVASANYDRTRVALVLVPLASRAQVLWDTEWKDESVGRKGYTKAL